jgi:hypothetical protein
LFHGDDGTSWQSGNPIDVGDEEFSSAGRSIQAGDRILVITDDAMDPLVWQGAIAAINEKGGEPVLCMWPRLDHHFADPPQMAIEAARGAMCLMEEMTVEILTGAMHFGIAPRRRSRQDRQRASPRRHHRKDHDDHRRHRGLR